MIEIKFTGSEPAELVQAMSRMVEAYGGSAAPQPEPEVKARKAAPKKEEAEREREPEPEAKKAAPKKAAPKKEDPQSEPEEPAGKNALTYDTIRQAVVDLAAAKGRGAVVAVLDTFGVDHASKIDEAQWGEALNALKDALED